MNDPETHLLDDQEKESLDIFEAVKKLKGLPAWEAVLEDLKDKFRYNIEEIGTNPIEEVDKIRGVLAFVAELYLVYSGGDEIV